jgi:hypothetical protein
MILSNPTPDGYIFSLKDETIGVGTYTDDGFTLLECDNSTSTHRNGMLALVHLRVKHTPEFYNVPVKPHNLIMPRVKEVANKLERYYNHPALKDVYPLAVD